MANEKKPPAGGNSFPKEKSAIAGTNPSLPGKSMPADASPFLNGKKTSSDDASSPNTKIIVTAGDHLFPHGKTAPAGNNPFLPEVMASLEELHALLPDAEYAGLCEEIRALLAAPAQEHASPDFLAAALRCKLFALLALANGSLAQP